jgi:hypothetical protein
MILSWTILPSSRAITVAHAFNTPTKVTKFDYTPSCISWNNLSAFCPWLHCICPNIMVVQVTTSQDGILLNISQTSSMLPHFAYIWTMLFPTNINSRPPSNDWNSCKTTKIGKAHVGCKVCALYQFCFVGCGRRRKSVPFVSP